MFGISPTLSAPSPARLTSDPVSALFALLSSQSILTHDTCYCVLALSPLPGLVHSFQLSRPQSTLFSPTHKLRDPQTPREPSSEQSTTFPNETKQNESSHPKMKKLTIAAVVAIASQAFAEPLPYRPAKAFLSAREIFGLGRRDTDVYHPKQSVCGVAATCSEAVRRFPLLPTFSFNGN